MSIESSLAAKSNKSLKVNVLGEHATLATELGITTGTGRPNKWMVSSSGTLLPSMTVSTPPNLGSTFNSKLKGGNANASEWVKWAGTSKPIYGLSRGFYAHTGMTQFLKVANGDNNPKLSSQALCTMHEIFIENISKHGDFLSDKLFSEEAFFAYDSVLNDLFANDKALILKYEIEKTAIAAGRTSPRPRPLEPTKNMGGTIYNVTDSKTLLPYYNKIKKNQFELTGVNATESHIFSQEFLKMLSESSSLVVSN